MSEMDQEDIDKLLADALGSDDDNDGSPMGQNDIDALLAEASNTANDTPMGQDDIDALLAQNNSEDDTILPDDTPMGQDDIDALLAQNNADDDTPMGQDDIDALLAQNNADDDTSMGQDDIDALLSNAIEDNDSDSLLDQNSVDDMLSTANNNVMDQSDIDTLLNSDDELNDIEDQDSADSYDIAEDLGAMGQDDIDALLAGALDDNTKTALNSDDSIPTSEDLAEDDSFEEEELDIDSFNLDSDDITDFQEELLEEESADSLNNYNPESIQEAIASPEATAPSYAPPPIPKISAINPTPAPQLSEEQMRNIQESLSLSGSSGEVENLAGQMSGLLGQLSERARRFQAAWITADQESRELRHALTLNQQKVHVLIGEKESLQGEISTLRKQYSQVEGEKLAGSEAHRTEIASLELQLREQESRNNMIMSEVSSLKEELERARNETTGSDLESRRSRFELERVNSELSSERQERQRLARALENREKELQAMQAQSAGHASTLFLDELHRLVRRLESELDIRTSSANEALSVIDRIEFHPEQQMYATSLRTAIAAAAGLTPDENDALKILDKQSQIGQKSLEPAPPPGADSFNSALERYDFAKASAIASASMRSGEKNPLDFVKEIHHAAVLKRPEISRYLDDLAAMLRGIKNLQEASDRARGKEGDTTEIIYVLIFDLLHTFVRMKLISRANTSIWDLFLELRGRFSFLTSDRQWKEYRDRLLSGSKINA